MTKFDKSFEKRPNIMIITTDEERYPPPYENEAARLFRQENSKVFDEMRAHGIEFKHHHAASTACAPSRVTIYTGQYPSLHGVSQTPGIGKSSYDQNMFWLEPGTTPTLGNYFQAAGYQTHYRGKWHLNHPDLDIPGTRTSVLSNTREGIPFPDRIALYEHANQLQEYGFNNWIGPEPHGNLEANSGTSRDGGFADQVCRSIDQLEQQAKNGDDTPFLLVSSFLNPHDIVLFGAPWFSKFQQMQAEGKLPQVDEPPTANESLLTKPRCQKDYLYTYPRMIAPQPTNETYRQFYYFLMAEVHKHITRVYQHLKNSSLFDNTIVIFTSDHGELLGSHGGLQQKWYNAYNETLHVPLIISNPKLFPEAKTSELYTSHIDLLPTILGLAGIDQEATRLELAKSHSEAQKLVGRDLSDVVTGKTKGNDEPIYFMTDDNPEVGTQMVNPMTQLAYDAIIQPKHVETVITKIPLLTGEVTWKYSRYYDNPRFAVGQVGNPDNITTPSGIPDEYECYDLNADPLELENRMSPICPNPLPEDVQKALDQELGKQHSEKLLYPQTLNTQNTNDDDSNINNKPQVPMRN